MDIFGRTGRTPGQWNPGRYGRGVAYDREVSRRMSGGKTGGASLLLTGDKELDRALAQFEPKVQKKYARTALNNAIKIVHEAYKRLVPVKSGSMRDAAQRRTPKGKRGQLRRALVISRDRLVKLYQARTGKPPGKRKNDTEPFFYPAVVELGDKDTPAERPMRAALYGNEAQVKAEFVNQLRAAVAAAGK